MGACNYKGGPVPTGPRGYGSIYIYIYIYILYVIYIITYSHLTILNMYIYTYSLYIIVLVNELRNVNITPSQYVTQI